MTATISLTGDQVMAALGTVLRGMLATGTEVVVGQVNRVPEPIGPNFVVMWPLLRTRLSTNLDTFVDTPLTDPPVARRDSDQSTQLTVQVDCHGPAGGDNAQIVSTLLRDEHGIQAFEALGLPVVPLYTEDPRQMPFENAEQATEDRWMVDVALQINPVIGTPQDFADVVVVTPIIADGGIYPI